MFHFSKKYNCESIQEMILRYDEFDATSYFSLTIIANIGFICAVFTERKMTTGQNGGIPL